MKRIAIFCDGTWNRLAGGRETSVARLAKAVRPQGADAVPQIAFYVRGVGTGRGTTVAAQAIDVVGGGAFGWGLTANIEEAFRFLVFNHAPGDEIFLFGFSRGAYTARSLAGLMRSAGIPLRRNAGRIPEAIAHYRDRGSWSHPNAERSFRLRLDLSPHLVTSPEERDWRLAGGHRDAPLLSVAYLGVWDTVGALGLPGMAGVIAEHVNARYAFHDTDLSRMVAAARHAVAADERRRFYPPTLWANLDALAADAPAGSYRQEWFPGRHGQVGGREPPGGLGAAALHWVVEGAEAKGLAFDAEALAAPAPDPLAGPARLGQAPGPGNLFNLLLADREGPARLDRLSEAARTRLTARADYRPGSLARAFERLSG